MMDTESVLNEVYDELSKARSKFPPFNSPHEGYAVILEELDELWEEVRRRKEDRHKDAIRDEAIQVAAMAVRFVVDVCSEPLPKAVHIGGSMFVPEGVHSASDDLPAPTQEQIDELVAASPSIVPELLERLKAAEHDMGYVTEKMHEHAERADRAEARLRGVPDASHSLAGDSGPGEAGHRGLATSDPGDRCPSCGTPGEFMSHGDYGFMPTDKSSDDRSRRLEVALRDLLYVVRTPVDRTRLQQSYIESVVQAAEEALSDDKAVEEPVRHNHVTRDIKALGVCPKCDEHHARNLPTDSASGEPS